MLNLDVRCWFCCVFVLSRNHFVLHSVLLALLIGRREEHPSCKNPFFSVILKDFLRKTCRGREPADGD